MARPRRRRLCWTHWSVTPRSPTLPCITAIPEALRLSSIRNIAHGSIRYRCSPVRLSAPPQRRPRTSCRCFGRHPGLFLTRRIPLDVAGCCSVTSGRHGTARSAPRSRRAGGGIVGANDRGGDQRSDAADIGQHACSHVTSERVRRTTGHSTSITRARDDVESAIGQQVAGWSRMARPCRPGSAPSRRRAAATGQQARSRRPTEMFSMA